MRVAINGFGRIGRAFYRVSGNYKDINIVAINDLADKNTLKFLLENDSVHGKFKAEDFDKVQFFSEKDPSQLPWNELNVDIVIESTGLFKKQEDAQKHINAGAKRVIISAPSPDAKIVLPYINPDDLATVNISSNASCTTNASAPVLKVLMDTIGVEAAMLNTVHAYTSSQRLVDSPHKDLRRARAAAVNIIPTSTGAAKATARVLKDLDQVFDGIAVRVPVPSGSLLDLTFISKESTTVDNIKEIFQKAAESHEWQGILDAREAPVVSSDIISDIHASIVDLEMIRVVSGNFIKLLVWYDNEFGYANMLCKHALKADIYT